MMQYSCLPRSIKFIQLFSAVVIFFENNKIEPWHEHSFVVIKQDGSDEPHLNKLTKHIMAVIWYIQHGHMCILHHHNVKVIFYPRSCLKEEEFEEIFSIILLKLTYAYSSQETDCHIWLVTSGKQRFYHIIGKREGYNGLRARSHDHAFYPES